jgi:hypothetical protein
MTSQNSEKPTRERSPSFPFIPLKTAIERLTEFEAKFGRAEPTADRSYLAWGMKGDTSQAQQTLAALKAFGLVQYKGAGPKRLVSISEDGRTYLRAQQESVKKEILKRIALRPKWVGHFWSQWGADRIPDEIRLDTLVLSHRFNENAAPTFLKVYDETIAYAGLSTFDKVIGVKAAETDLDDTFDELENENGQSDQSLTSPSQKREQALMAGERILTTGLLSKDASFRLIVTGHISAKEIDRLIQKLQLDKEILAEPSDADPTN